MRATDRPCRTFYGGDRRAPGELLWPARFPEDIVRKNERTLGPRGTAAQYQQRPDVEGGQIFKREWWRFWGEGREPCLCNDCFRDGVSRHDSGRDCVPLPEKGFDFQSWDLTFKGNARSDFVAGGAFRSYGGRVFLRAFMNERLDFAATKARMKSWEPYGRLRLVEDAANGPAIESELGNITLVKPQGGKEERAHSVTAMLSEGVVFLPKDSYKLMAQCEAFPVDAHDDMVDMLTQGLIHVRNSFSSRLVSAMGARRGTL